MIWPFFLLLGKMTRLLPFILILNLASCSLFTKKESSILNDEFWFNEAPRNNSLKDNVLLQEQINQKQELLAYLQKWKRDNSIESPSVVNKKSLNLSIINRSIKLLPKAIYDYLEKKTHKIILASNLGVPILVLPIFDQNNNLEKDSRFLIFIDKNINARGLNDWYSWREETAFKGKNLRGARFETYLSHTNSVFDTVHFIFSQAVALIISWDKRYFPLALEKSKMADYEVLKSSWTNNKGVINSTYEKFLADIKFLSYYGKSNRTFSIDKMFEFYRRIERTNYVNLYSSTGPLRDFVESTALFFHTYYYHRPFTIDFYKNNILLDTYSNCYKTPRCLQKKYVIQKIISDEILQE